MTDVSSAGGHRRQPRGPLNGRLAEAARNDQRILDSARAVFVADPGAPITAVAKHAGVGISALYTRYASKDELLRKLCTDGLARVVEENEHAIDALAAGADHWQVFSRIYARMAFAPMATLAVLTYAAYWNEFFRPLIFLQTSSKFTLPLGLVSLQGYFGTGSVSIVLAGVVIALIPSVLIFAAAQRYFVEGIVAGSFR